jgi:hypothetical protein
VLSVKRGRHAMGSPFYVGTGRRIGWWGVARELETSWRLSDLLCLIRDTITCCKGVGAKPVRYGVQRGKARNAGVSDSLSRAGRQIGRRGDRGKDGVESKLGMTNRVSSE